MIYKHNGSIITDISGKWLTGGSTPVDPYNPLNLPPNVVRVRTSDGEPPYIRSGYTTYESATLVSGTTDVYDVYKSGNNLDGLCYGCDNIVEVLGANTTGVTKMGSMFQDCLSLTSVPLFDTSSVTSMSYMFLGCPITTVPLYDTSSVTSMCCMFQYSDITTVPLFDTSNVKFMQCMFNSCDDLTSIPLFDTSRVTNMDNMFYNCTNVNGGALALYQQASTKTNPPIGHDRTFENCGIDTVNGAAELAQIPSDWK